ncbi:uncharacterized protein K452DRAFT_99072 [Aplosporella prunicola CBS 121167]|uniref:Uncharacterized protein n=1 Tax=Aplosporella prunicola CBS 121167 TaxID=1176127 RepID=A0A6A6B494_9PEZI|nr:uncharacterized protein K452DRAFT_99072 [Aplosporella prunicola CBS 121167]KAF2137571.1 hypothetical protein K452DRAFT_99072 [Aplosporella prunicola CBS 121167]
MLVAASTSGAPSRAQTVFSLGNLQPRTAAAPPRTGRAYWAPPRSGHGPFNAGVTDQSYPFPDSGTGRSPEERQLSHEPAQHASTGPGTPYTRPSSSFRQPFTPQDDAVLQNNIPTAAAAGSAATTSPSTPPNHSQLSMHDLIPAPLFTSPPHSRQGLDPRVPESAYDRVTHMVNREGTQGLLDTNQCGSTAADGPLNLNRPSATATSLRDSNADAETAVPDVQLAPTNTHFATTPTTPDPDPTLCNPINATSSYKNKQKQPSSPIPTHPTRPATLHLHTSPYSSTRPATPPGTGLIRSAALPSLLPIAAKEGIVRPRGLPLPRAVPASTRSTASVHLVASVPFGALVLPGPSHRSGTSFHSAASTRALYGSATAGGSSASSAGTQETWRTARTAQATPVAGGIAAPVVPEALRPKARAPMRPGPGNGAQSARRSGQRNRDRLMRVVMWCCCQPFHSGSCGCEPCTARRARRMRRGYRWVMFQGPVVDGAVHGMV